MITCERTADMMKMFKVLSEEIGGVMRADCEAVAAFRDTRTSEC